MSEDAAAVIVRTVRELPAGVEPATLVEAEGFLLGQAAEHDPKTLTALSRHLAHVLDPDAGAGLEDVERAAVQARHLSLSPDPQPGVQRLRGRLDDETAALLMTVLDPLAAPRPAGADDGCAGADGCADGDADGGGKDPRSPARRRADALADLLRGVADGGGLPTAGGERPHLTVTVPLATLEQRLGARAGELDFDGPFGA